MKKQREEEGGGKPRNKKKKCYQDKRRALECFYCGSQNIQQSYCKHVGTVNTCRDCGELVN